MSTDVRRVGEGEWADVDPTTLRSWADCETWGDLDYFIAARTAMIRMSIGRIR